MNIIANHPGDKVFDGAVEIRVTEASHPNWRK